MDSEKEPIFAAQGSSEAGKDEQPLYYDKANHPILVSERVRAVGARFGYWLAARCHSCVLCCACCVPRAVWNCIDNA